MPLEDVLINVDDDPSYSDEQSQTGILTKVITRYESVAAVVVTLQIKLGENEWEDFWSTPSSNTADSYVPVKPATLPDGTAASNNSPITLDSPWRLKVTGASSGSVQAFVGVLT